MVHEVNAGQVVALVTFSMFIGSLFCFCYFFLVESGHLKVLLFSVLDC